MANYCGKCGSKLDEATGICPNCDAAKIKQHYDKTTEDKTPVRKEDKIDKRTKKKELKARKKRLNRKNGRIGLLVKKSPVFWGNRF